MINGNVNEFVNNLYYGQEMNFSYADKQYFIQGWKENNIFTIELYQIIPLTTSEGYCIWKNNSVNPQECVNDFFNVKLFDGKSFWEVEQEIEWLYDWPINDEEETKMYYMKHPEDVNLPNALRIDLTPRKISEMDENFQNFAKRILTKSNFGTCNDFEFYNKSGEVMTAIEFLIWYFKEGFKCNEYDWKASNYKD